MNKRKAYQILGLTEGASEQEIRRRYKKLAMKVHPDINPDKNAHEKFIILSLAVECLLKPETESPATRTSRSSTKNEETPEEQLARMNEAKLRFEEQKKRNQQENVRYFRSLVTGKRWRAYKIIMWIGIALAASLVLDNFLPRHFEEDTIENYSSLTHNGIAEDKICMMHFRNTGVAFVQNNPSVWTTTYPEVLIEKTWILHNSMNFYSTDDYSTHKTAFDFDLLSIRWLIIVVLLVPLFPYFRQRMSIQFVFFYQFSFWMVGFIELVILISQNRLVHLFSLGFF